MFAVDENDPDSTTKSKIAFALWMFGLVISIIVSLVFCPQDWSGEVCLTGWYSFILFLAPILIALAIIQSHSITRS
ncbi:unnamed protein product [Hymenolepis diminuta]|uniref:Uncharacterized protein n=1 Tax=Hymenolepis diminuta TaxID=6216 RepID=A0A564XZ33_HYMDI|nr:unnamed protein product [Hymenolepis diminuta]